MWQPNNLPKKYGFGIDKRNTPWLKFIDFMFIINRLSLSIKFSSEPLKEPQFLISFCINKNYSYIKIILLYPGVCIEVNKLYPLDEYNADKDLF